MSKINIEQLAKKHGTPLFLLSKSKLHQTLKKMRTLLPRVTPYYAVKANPHDLILKQFTRDATMGFDVASRGEIERVLAAGGNMRYPKGLK
jgi:ornithine decarboxylase